MPIFRTNDQIISCPKCGSNDLDAESIGYDEGMGFLGMIVFGPGGLGLGEMDTDELHFTCLNCGC